MFAWSRLRAPVFLCKSALAGTHSTTNVGSTCRCRDVRFGWLATLVVPKAELQPVALVARSGRGNLRPETASSGILLSPLGHAVPRPCSSDSRHGAALPARGARREETGSGLALWPRAQRPRTAKPCPQWTPRLPASSSANRPTAQGQLQRSCCNVACQSRAKASSASLAVPLPSTKYGPRFLFS